MLIIYFYWGDIINVLFEDFYINEEKYYKIRVSLPKTNLLVVGNDIGYFMCGALDVGIFDSKPHLQKREVVCGRALGVKTLEELLEAPLYEVSLACFKYGITREMKVRDALIRLT